MKLKESRGLSFILIVIVYLLALAAGIGVYVACPFALWAKLLLADIAATVVTFIFSLLFQNASVYDPYWSVQPISILFLLLTEFRPTMSAVLPLIAVALWGIRLTANWAYTFKNLTAQDWRYTMLKEKTGKLYPLVNFFGIHLVPTLVVYACILPVVYTLADAPAFNIGAAVFFIVSLAAVLLQGTADCQMHAFRKRGTGGFIRSGVWKWSRHPNYLGEILMWWGIGLAGLCVMPQRWYLLLGAVLNTLLFLFISIPMADTHQARKKGFEAYKSQTRMLLPFPKKAR